MRYSKVVPSALAKVFFALLFLFPSAAWACGDGGSFSAIRWPEVIIGGIGGSLLILTGLLPAMIGGTHKVVCLCGQTRVAKWTGTPCSGCGAQDTSNGAMHFYGVTILLIVPVLLGEAYFVFNGYPSDKYIFGTWALGLIVGLLGGIGSSRPWNMRVVYAGVQAKASYHD